ncbi:MAG: MaoC/PaaZ C-terminal domain-containing protein [Hyphomicrobiales bacterium]
MATLNVGDRRDQVVLENINRTHIVKYAGAGGDFNPLHHDDTFAQKVGYPSVFAHGMFSMGLTGKMLTDWVGPVALRKYGVRFTKQVFPGDTLTAHGEVTEVKEENGEKLATIRVWTTNQKDETVIEGQAVAAVS